MDIFVSVSVVALSGGTLMGSYLLVLTHTLVVPAEGSNVFGMPLK